MMGKSKIQKGESKGKKPIILGLFGTGANSFLLCSSF
jgi:hypothetical protein